MPHSKPPLNRSYLPDQTHVALQPPSGLCLHGPTNQLPLWRLTSYPAVRPPGTAAETSPLSAGHSLTIKDLGPSLLINILQVLLPQHF